MSGQPVRSNPFATSGVPDLSDMTPKPAPPPQRETARTQERAAVREIAETSGFTLNNLTEKPIKAARKTTDVPTFLKTMRLNISDYNRFQEWCNENGYSQKTGFQILVANIPKR